MIINFNTYDEMIAWTNPAHNDIGIVKVLQKSYTYNGTIQLWLCPVQDKCVHITQTIPTGATTWAPTIAINEYTYLSGLTSDVTSLIVSMAELPDTWYEYEFRFKFDTPSTLGITTFQVKDSNGTDVTWMGSSPSLVASKTYEVSVIKNLAVIIGTV